MAEVEIRGLSLTELDESAEQFADVVDQGIEQVVGELLEKIRSSQPVTAAEDINPDELPGEGEADISESDADSVFALWVTFIDSTIMPFLLQSMRSANREQADSIISGLGMRPPSIDEPVATEKYLQQARNRLVGIGDEIWFNTRTAITEGLNAGEAFNTIADRIQDVVPVTTPRANTIARTESNSARNSVAMSTVRRVDMAFGATGGIRKKWQATGDSRTRDTHRRADGQEVGLNESFRVGRASLDHPSDPGGPAEEVINCRCVSLTVIDTDMINMESAGNTVSLNASSYQGENMPWFLERNHEECSSGQWAVVKEDNGEVEGCHDTRDDAVAQLSALNAAEADEGSSRTQSHSFQVDPEAPWGDLTTTVEFEDSTVEYRFTDTAVVIDGDTEHELTVGERVGEAGFIFEWTNDDEALVHLELNFDMGTANINVTDSEGNEITKSGSIRQPDSDDEKTEEGENMTAASNGRHKFVRWSGVIATEGTPTGDGRQFEEGALTWPDVGVSESLEMSFGWLYERAHGGVSTDKVANIGRVDTIERRNNDIFATGVIDINNEYGRRAIEQMGTREQPGYLAGVSIDADDPEDPTGRNVEYIFPAGCSLENKDDDDEYDAACMVPELAVYKSGRIRALTLVDIPAFVEGRIYLDEEPELDSMDNDTEDVVTASSGATYTITLPEVPPAEWFQEPVHDPDIGAITITDEGRIYGYLAPKGVAHRGYQDRRVEVPMKNVDYSIWQNRATIVENNGTFEKVKSGPITMDCGHAPMTGRVRGAQRQDHYDNSCSVVATACVGENAKGVWIAGAILPDVTAEQIQRMMTLQLSGDWGPHREKPGKRELAGALLVPRPGFPRRAYQKVTVDQGQLSKTLVPLRFTVNHTEEPETFNAKYAAHQIAASIGRDPVSKLKAFAHNLREG